jgi:hypothetical protein
MTPNDDRDTDLERRLALLPRAEAPSPEFTDALLRGLERRGLVRSHRRALSARWLAAAAVIFAAGIGVGALITRALSTPQTVVREAPSVPAVRNVADVNVPRVGQSEVWF